MMWPRPGGDEGIAIVSRAGEAEGLAAADVERAHPAERAVPDVLELAPHWLPRHHREIGVATFERLNARLLIDAHDVLGRRRLVVDAQYIVALLPELLVVRGKVHLLPMRLEIRVMQDPRYRAVAELDALRAHVLPEQRRRPMRDRQPDIARRPTSFGLDPCRYGIREREGGRPERGASANVSEGSSALRKRCRHFSAVRE